MTSTTHPSPLPVEVVDRRLTATLYDPSLWISERLGFRALRRRALAGARGAVLEIGAGTGLNLPHYPAAVEELVLAEPGEQMASHIDLGRAPDGIPVRAVHAPAEALPFPDARFDTVVATLVLCTVADPHRALREARRVLRPGGQLLFLEHVRADGRWRAGLQRRCAGAWAAFAAGCRCDRPTLSTLESELRVAELHRARWRGMPSIVTPLIWGRAVARD